MNKNITHLLTLFLAGIFTGSTAVAGIVDSPISKFPDGSKAKHRFSVPGVASGLGGLETVFMCTSMEKTKTIQIGVEVFHPFGGDPRNDISASEGVVQNVVPVGPSPLKLKGVR